jgi:hypothetical protein
MKVAGDVSNLLGLEINISGIRLLVLVLSGRAMCGWEMGREKLVWKLKRLFEQMFAMLWVS